MRSRRAGEGSCEDIISKVDLMEEPDELTSLFLLTILANRAASILAVLRFCWRCTP